MLTLPFDIIDHIFSFLKSHPKALLACSRAHPLLSQIAERYRFRHIVICTGFQINSNITYSFRLSDLLRYLAETPRIANYVAVLQVELNPYQDFEGIASLLLMFPALECIMLPTPRKDSAISWKALPQNFRTAVENCLCLPTLREVHVGNTSFPLSTLDNHANINYLSLAGPPEIEPLDLKTTHPQIKSLAFEGFEHQESEFFCTWARQHILKLQKLKYDFSCHEIILEVFNICSNIEDLYLCLHREGTPRELSSRLA